MYDTRKKIHIRLSSDEYEAVREMQHAGGYRSPAALVTQIVGMAIRAHGHRPRVQQPQPMDEVAEIFDDLTNHEAPVYGMGRRRIGRKQP